MSEKALAQIVERRENAAPIVGAFRIALGDATLYLLGDDVVHVLAVLDAETPCAAPDLVLPHSPLAVLIPYGTRTVKRELRPVYA